MYHNFKLKIAEHKKKVCVIGAGLCGLVMMKYLAESPEIFKVIAYEQTPHIGGMWVYTDRVGTDEEGLPIHTSMYKHLRANFPKQMMELDEYPIPEDWPSYLTHSQYLTYLEHFADYYKLIDNIHFKTKVTSVVPTLLDSGQRKWHVSTVSLTTLEEDTKRFDIVIVCNGQYSIPYFPEINGLSTFKGTYTHSHEFRVPDGYADKNMLVVGASFSGQEIATQLLKFATNVYLSHPCEEQLSSISQDIQQVAVINEIQGSKITLKDSTELEDIDSIIFCTGYRKDLSFLHESCCPNYHDQRVTPLYQQIIHVEHPSLLFIGVLGGVPVPMCATVQSRFVLSYLKGKFTLPSKTLMYAHIKRMFAKIDNHRGPPRTYWDYYDELAELGRFKKLPHVKEKILEVAWERLRQNICNARDVNFVLKNSSDFEEIPIGHRRHSRDFNALSTPPSFTGGRYASHTVTTEMLTRDMAAKPKLSNNLVEMSDVFSRALFSGASYIEAVQSQTMASSKGVIKGVRSQAEEEHDRNQLVDTWREMN